MELGQIYQDKVLKLLLGDFKHFPSILRFHRFTLHLNAQGVANNVTNNQSREVIKSRDPNHAKNYADTIMSDLIQSDLVIHIPTVTSVMEISSAL